MMEFLNPVLFGGLAAVSAPVIIHLLHRRKFKRVDWGAMRFLLEMMARSRRRLFLEEILLLLLRALVLACLALAMVRPAWHSSNKAANGAGLTRQGRVAAVLLIDDSVSAAAGRAQPAFEAMKKLGAGYIDSLAAGDELSVILMSQLGGAPSDPLFDLEAVKTSLASLKPSYVATDVPALMDAGLNQLKRHINPGAEVVLLTDGRKDGWHQDERARWDDLRQRLRGPKNAALGTRQRPRVLVLAPPAAEIDDNLAITALDMDRTLVSAGKPAGIRVGIGNFGHQGARGVTVQVSVNGELLGTKQVEVPANGGQETVFTHTFPEPGSYAVEAALLENRDLLPADDRRALSLSVEPSLPVLLVEDTASRSLESKLGFLAYALAPEPDPRGTFQVTRLPVTQFTPSSLSGFRVVVLGDLRALEPAMLDALERFVVSGGGVLVGLGPDSALDFINRNWARGGEGFLPCPLGRVEVPPRPAVPADFNRGHPVFSGFGTRSDQAWKEARVKSYFRLDAKSVKPADLDVLLRLDTGDGLVVERRRGLGLVALVTTSLNADWSDLPLQAAYVPLVRGLVGHLGNFIIPPRNLRPGEPIIYARVKDPAQSMQVQSPGGNSVPLALGAWEGRDALFTEPLAEPGVYLLRDPKEPGPIRFAVALASSESSLVPMPERDMAEAFNKESALFRSPEQIAENLDPARRQSVEWWKGLLVAAAACMFVESWMTRREAASGAGPTS